MRFGVLLYCEGFCGSGISFSRECSRQELSLSSWSQMYSSRIMEWASCWECMRLEYVLVLGVCAFGVGSLLCARAPPWESVRLESDHRCALT